jgi:hypothetical protein
MSPTPRKHLSASCRCGKVTFEMTGAPIVAAACFCASCQEAGQRFEQLRDAPPVLDADGGTPCLLYRKDRVRCTAGQDQLDEHRLKPTSPTRRVIATCCNSAMFLDFTKGHWLSMYRERFTEGAPKIEMRVATQDLRPGVKLADDVTNYATHTGMFIVKLLLAWVAMGFRTPKNTLGAKP